MSIIDPDRHADLVDLQRQANAAWERLERHAPDVRGIDLTDEQRAEAARLRTEVAEAAQAVRDALYESGLVTEYGYFAPAQELKAAARSTA